jgi:anti-sigma-K factor RskA
MDHGQLEEAVASYALGVLDDAERHEVEALLLDHLPGCDSCRRMLADFREVAGDLALVAGPAGVRPALEEELMERIRGVKPAAARAVPGRTRWWARAGIAAAMVAIAAMSAWTVRLGAELDDARSRTVGLARAITLIGSPDAQTVRLDGRQGTLLFAQRPGEAVLVARDLAGPGDGRVFQLWLMRAGTPVDAGTFLPDDGVVILGLGHDASGFDAVAVTIERAPGARAPTSAPIFSASLRA